MKKIILLSFLSVSILSSSLVPLSKKNMDNNRDSELSRGTYLIVLSNPDLNNLTLGTFVNLKRTQGYDVEVVSFRAGDLDIEGINGEINDDLRNYLINF